MSTVHANTPKDAFSRLETMCMMADLEIPTRVILQHTRKRDQAGGAGVAPAGRYAQGAEHQRSAGSKGRKGGFAGDLHVRAHRGDGYGESAGAFQGYGDHAEDSGAPAYQRRAIAAGHLRGSRTSEDVKTGSAQRRRAAEKRREIKYVGARLFELLPRRSDRVKMRSMLVAGSLLIGVVALSGLVSIDWFAQDMNAKMIAAQVQIESFLVALEVYKRDTGRYPSTAEGLAALRVSPASAQNWLGPYMPRDIPSDPWDREYVYTFPGAHGPGPDIVSYGADGLPGGSGRNADTVSWRGGGNPRY